MEWLTTAYATIRGWFKEADWIANAIGIVTALVGVVLLVRSKADPLFGPSTFAALTESRINSVWNTASVKAVAEIAILDDNPDDFPVPELRKADYRVRVYKEVGLNDMS